MSSPSSNLSQFQLRTLFIVVAVLAVVFAAARYGGWPGLLAAGTFAALAAAHIIGNVLGTKLRDEVSPQWNPKPNAPTCEARQVNALVIERRLHERTPLGRIIRLSSGGAAVVGATLGGLALAFWTSASIAGWFVGTLSSAVVGGFVGFLLASFLEMTIRAWWQAAKRQ